MNLTQQFSNVFGGARQKTSYFALWIALLLFCWSGVNSQAIGQCTSPPNVSVNNITSSSATITWNTVANALNYEITYNQQGNPATTTQQTTGSSLFIPNLAPGTAYEVKVRSVCGSGTVSGNNQVSFSTQGTTCIAPSNLTAASSSTTSLTLNWSQASGAINYFVSFNPVGNPNVVTVPASAPPFELVGLQANTDYQIMVRSNCGVNGLSNFATITANPNGTGGGGGGGTCTTPTNFRTTTVGATSVTVGWTAVTGALNYEVSYKRSDEANFTTFNSTTNSAVLSNLTANSVYEARVRSACGSNNFSNSTSTTFTTPNAGNTCNPPSNFRVTATTGTTADLAWNGVGGAVNYEITYRRVGDPLFTSVTTNNSVITLNSLQSTMNYEVRIRSFCGGELFSSFLSSTFTTGTGGGGGDVCAAPSGLTAINLTAVSATLSWANVPNAVAYQVRFRIAGGGFSTGNSSVNSFPLTGLLPLTSYEAFVLTVCSNGNSTESTTTFTTPSAINCVAPSNFSVSSITGTTAQLTWSVVGAANSYEVQYRRSVDANFSTVVSVPAFFGLTNLSPNTTYEARVRTTCANSTNSDFVSTTFVTGSNEACNAPAGFQASAITSTSVTLAFNVVTSALDYEISYRPTSGTVFTTITSTNASATINNLTPNTGYEFRVRSRCVGSVFSTFSTINATTSTGTGNCIVPTGLTASNVAGNSLTLSWGAINGITNYEVQYRKVGDATFITQNVGTNNINLTNLSSGSTYEIKVRSACANSTFSDFATTSVVTSGSSCQTPSNLVINNIGGTSATATWSLAPGVSTYEVGIRRVGDVNFTIFTSFNSTFNFSNLNILTNYEVQVRGICTGANVFSQAISTVFTTTNGSSSNCFTPSGLVATAVTTFAGSVAWNTVPGINAYEVSYRPTNNGFFTTFAVTSNSTQLVGLTPNTSYEVRVRTMCPGNTFSGFISTNFTTTISGSACEPPSSLAATNVNSGGVTVTWNAAALAKGYEISYRLSSSAVYTTENTISSIYFINNLLPGQVYEVRVRSNCGNGLFSNYAAVTFTTVLSTGCVNPSELVVSNPTNTGVTLSWAQVAFASQIEYELSYRSVGTGIYLTQRTRNNTVILSNLIPDQEYEWRVRTICASNAQSNYSSSTFKTANGVGFCATPTNLFPSNFTQNGARLDWTAVKNVGSYEVRIKRNGDIQSQTYTTALNMYSFSGLIPGSTYTVELRSICFDGFLSLPIITSFMTVAEQGCNPPSNFKVSNIGLNSSLLTWTGSPNASSYEIMYRRQGDIQTTTFQVGGNTNSFLMAGLFRNTNYDVKIRTICQNNAISIYTGMLFTTADNLQCLTPTRFTAGDVTDQSVRLSWDAVTGSNSYEVSLKKVGDSAFEGVNVQGLTKTYVNLLPNTEYEARIRTNCSSTNSFSNYSSVKFTTSVSQNPCLAPELMLTSVTNSVATINWMAIQKNYELQYRVIGTNYVSRLENLPPPYILKDLSANTTYEVRVRNFCDTRTTDFSNVLLFTTKANSCTPPTIALKSKSANTIAINISNGNSVVEINYKETGASSYTRILITNTGSYNISGVLTNRSYDIQVRNFCGGIFSDYSNQLTVTANNLLASCEVPTLDVASVSARSAFIFWPTRMSLYEVNVRDVKLNETKRTYESNVGSLLLNNLNTNTAYEVSIRNICNGAFSEASAPVRFTTRVAKEEGIGNEINGNLSVYPNPNNGHFTIKFDSEVSNTAFITMMDVSGRIVYSSTSTANIGINEIPVQTESISGGIYMLKLNINGVISTQKVVLN